MALNCYFIVWLKLISPVVAAEGKLCKELGSTSGNCLGHEPSVLCIPELTYVFISREVGATGMR
jgi:hypothetical protein